MGASLANAVYARSIVTPTRSRIAHCKRKFLRFFPDGFRDETYLEWERGYKLRAHEEWKTVLNRKVYQSKLSQGKFLEIGAEAVKIEARTNLLFPLKRWQFATRLSRNPALGISRKVSTLFFTAAATSKLDSVAGAKSSRDYLANRAACLLGR